ncbi:hypothetical protein SRS16CHR_03704 [Variovorax sp. SRS16]|uniref:hypothetical protein n=1 Tax=Variovorax sp. SRS16 TaxID=282217 RepID=UPI0013176196|nr:hypothetical protein [Variovorax sp. SRS16]VTU25664.1 hypothetical protein SRS16CHR_03704 [Variovorax sp. SRS16]
MAEPSSLDAFALVREMASQIEKSVNAYAPTLLKSDEFAQGANKAMGAALFSKKLAQDLTQLYVEALNLPSRKDILALADRLQSIEDRMIGMQATLDRMAGGGTSAALPAPPRTRKPPQEPVETVAAAAPSAPARKRGRKGAT